MLDEHVTRLGVDYLLKTGNLVKHRRFDCASWAGLKLAVPKNVQQAVWNCSIHELVGNRRITGDGAPAGAAGSAAIVATSCPIGMPSSIER